MKSIYSLEHLAALKQEGINVDEPTQQANQLAVENNASIIKPLLKPVRRKDNWPYRHSVFHFPKIGPVVPVKTLGKGAFGKVKKIINGKCIFYAMKISTYSDNDGHYGNYARECEALKLLKRFHDTETRKIIGAIDNKTKAYILTEFYDGPNAYEFIISHQNSKSFIPPEQALMILSSMVSELKCVHAVDLIHNDIKPRNFIITHFNQAKLVDFGVTLKPGLFIGGGTKGYLAPEIIKDKQQSFKSDIYALGCTFYDLFPIIEFAHSPLTKILYDLAEKMIDNSPSARPSLDEIDNTLTLLHITSDPIILNQIDPPRYNDLYELAIQLKAGIAAASIVLYIDVHSGKSGLNHNEGFFLRTALKYNDWKNTGILISMNADLSFYKKWHTLAEQSNHTDYLRALFLQYSNTSESLLRLYAMAVKQKIASLPMDSQMEERRRHTCQTLERIIENASPLEQARTILAAISTHGLKRRYLQDTAWAHIARSILIDYPAAAPQKPLLFSSCFKPASRDVTPVNLASTTGNINTLRPQLLNRKEKTMGAPEGRL